MRVVLSGYPPGMTDIEHLLRETSTIVVVGCSRHRSKAAHSVPAAMRSAGYRIVPVNPYADEILGERAHPSLDDLPDDVDVDLVNVFRPSGEASEVVRRAIAAGARAVWLQQGIRSDEAREAAERAGIGYIEDRCLAVERSRFGITNAG